MKPAIEITNLSKMYRIGHEQAAAAGTQTFRDALSGLVRKPIEIFTGHKLQQEKFWALKGINFTVESGDVLGIIGRNGSGKSTLLKILSRIVEPTSGQAILRGRAASLLEVGTGFHPELTGRENIYFNGSILGMKRKEITRKFDQIVEFSGVEKFLDTPVKFFSSGMYVRLAFAVAAFIESEILIVDEVLAVGDAEFQKKSLGKMRDVTRQDKRTVLFVSHNLESVASICSKVIWLNGGEVMKFGKTNEVIQAYIKAGASQSIEPLASRKDRQGTGRVICTAINVEEKVAKNREITVDLTIENQTAERFPEFKVSLDLFDDLGNHLSNLLNYNTHKKLPLVPGRNIIELTIRNINLVPGSFSFNVFLASDQYNTEIFDWTENAAGFTIPPYDYYRTGSPPNFQSKFIYQDFDFEYKAAK
jgi:lipopolysaccharide transport system ATP-binding protein